jgi:hypothetical protein
VIHWRYKQTLKSVKRSPQTNLPKREKQKKKKYRQPFVSKSGFRKLAESLKKSVVSSGVRIQLPLLIFSVGTIFQKVRGERQRWKI